MNNTITCIKCQEENAYYNGVIYECPDCDCEWDENQFEYIDDDDDYDAEERNDLNKLLNLEKPFFKLQPGKVYNCKSGYLNSSFDYVEESEKIIPLAFKENSNTFCVLLFNEVVLKQYPNFSKDLAAMNYTYIANGGLDKYFYKDTLSLVALKVATNHIGKIINMDVCFSDFNLVNKDS
jgi:hypothetical protein